MNRKRVGVLILGLAMMPVGAREASGPRVALVIGNARYGEEVGALKNPVNDGKAMAKALRGLGFSVTEEYNVNRDELWEALAGFRKQVTGSEVALFFYAGHGVSLGGSNYLVPLKAGYGPEDLDERSARLRAETKLMNADQVLAEMNAAKGGCRLVILDACRSTPIARNPSNRDGATVGGLAEMRPPAGSLVAFSTDAGRVASDGKGGNGLYTEQLLKHLQTPGLTIEQVFKRTRASVLEASGGSQLPAEYSRLIGEDIYLAGPPVERPAADDPPKARQVEVPGFDDIHHLAAEGDADGCLQALELRVAAMGPQDEAAVALDALLEMVKEELKRPTVATNHTRELQRVCEKVLIALVDCVPAKHPRRSDLAAKAQNRRGDCLLLEDRPAEALVCYNAATELAPDDAYPLYNRGRAHEAMKEIDKARLDYQAVADQRFKQPMAKRLALAALERLAEPASSPIEGP